MANKFDVDPDLVRKLAELLGETGLSEIEYESTGRRIRVARQIGGAAVVSVGAAASALTSKALADDAGDAPAQRKGTPVLSPMVGTVFASPEPGAEPFIRVGDTINEGQTVMLTTSGKVVQILVGDSTPVEFGEELLLVE
jgi:acetyl-CoA carboxylase biotin carboxyl carrier protein